MAKITLMKSPYKVKLPYQEGHLLKIWESEEEPPKKYVWKTPGGYLFCFYNNKWMLVDKYVIAMKAIIDASKQNNISEKDLDNLKSALLDKIAKYISVNGVVPEWLEERLAEIENKNEQDSEYDAYLKELIDRLDRENDEFVIVVDDEYEAAPTEIIDDEGPIIEDPSEEEEPFEEPAEEQVEDLDPEAEEPLEEAVEEEEDPEIVEDEPENS